jgi:GNAT superfamily N-acetyltransferase
VGVERPEGAPADRRAKNDQGLDRGRLVDNGRMTDLRAARTEDADDIVAIDSSLGPAEAIEAFVPCGASLVAVEGATIAGFVAVRPSHFYGRDFVDLLFVGSAFRRRGLGRLLLRSAVQRAATSWVFTSTNESNSPMRSLLGTESWSSSGILVGLEENDPEHVFFHDNEGR